MIKACNRYLVNERLKFISFGSWSIFSCKHKAGQTAGCVIRADFDFKIGRIVSLFRGLCTKTAKYSGGGTKPIPGKSLTGSRLYSWHRVWRDSIDNFISMENAKGKTIVFITGAFFSNSCWNNWRLYFEEKGYHTAAPPWPHKDASSEVLRSRHPDEAIASNRLAGLTDHYAGIVGQYSEPPILIGHSLGGLIVQLLLQRGLGKMGIAIHSVPPQGIFTFKFSFLKAGWGPLGFFTSTKKTFLVSFRQWQYGFTNGMKEEEQEASYYELAIPESKLVVRDTIGSAAKIDFRRARAPLLLTGGSSDHSIPASLNRSNFKRYRKSQSVTDYKEFEGRNHFVLGQPTWREDADYILDWIERQ